MSSSKVSDAIPMTDFYGESTSWPIADVIHCEQLSIRSALYDWQIKPHRHGDLTHIFYVTSGKGVARLDNRTLNVKVGDLLVVPNQCVHTFRWEKDCGGYVLTIALPLLGKLEQILQTQPWDYKVGEIYTVGDDKDFLNSLFAMLNDEYQGNKPNREVFVESLVTSFSIWLNRQYLSSEKSEALKNNKSLVKIDKFFQLLEEHYTVHHDVEWYAQKIGVTAAHLSTLCKSHQQKSALAIIHRRILVEAQRSLIYTGSTAANIAEKLGFADAAYFNRFFKRMTGLTPKMFRTQKRLVDTI
jgi:AraC family transcriptional activator of pobA